MIHTKKMNLLIKASNKIQIFSSTPNFLGEEDFEETFEDFSCEIFPQQ